MTATVTMNTTMTPSTCSTITKLALHLKREGNHRRSSSRSVVAGVMVKSSGAGVQGGGGGGGVGSSDYLNRTKWRIQSQKQVGILTL